jgi:hypothetical protein
VNVAEKLQIKPGQTVAVVAGDQPVPEGLLAGVEFVGDPAAADVVIAFVRRRADLTTAAKPALDAAAQDRLAWIAYPKGGKLGTDLNRDLLAAAVANASVQPVRQVAVDEVWSALRFRPL